MPPTDPAPQISGVTTSARDARLAAETPASAETVAGLPSGEEILAFLPGTRHAASADTGTTAEPAPEDEPVRQTEDSTEQDQQTEEAETDTEEQNEEQDDNEEEKEDHPKTLPPEAQKIRDSMQKRINELTASRTAAEQRATAAEQELQTLRAGATQPPTPTLVDIDTEQGLDQLQRDAQLAKQWALRNRHGGEVKGPEGKVEFYDADQVAEILADAEEKLAAIPDRRRWLDQVSQARQLGAKLAPEFYQEGHPAAKVLKETMANVPAYVKAWRPDIEHILLQALVGASVLAKRSPAAAPRKVPAAPPTPGARQAPRAPVAVIKQRQTREQATKLSTGGMAALEQVIADRFLA